MLGARSVGAAGATVDTASLGHFSAGSSSSLHFEKESRQWSSVRRACFHALESNVAETFIGSLCLASFVLACVEVDLAGAATPTWLTATNAATLVIFVLEAALKLYIMRWEFFLEALNIADAVIIVLDAGAFVFQEICREDVPSVAFLRIFRMFRLARGFRVIASFPQLALMVKCFGSAVVATVYGVLMLFVILTIWSVCAVYFVHPVNQRVSLTGAYDGCPRCGHAFSSVRSAMLTFIQQIIAGDSWGEVTIPIIEESPATAVFFMLVFVSVHFLTINVILSVIVDCALKASQQDSEAIVKHKELEFEIAERKLMGLVGHVDSNASGEITEQELLNGFDTAPQFQAELRAMDIKREDMKMVFSILDADDSGTVSREEFISQLFAMKCHDSHTMLLFIKHHVKQIREQMKTEVAVRQEMQAQVRGLTEEVHRITDPERTRGDISGTVRTESAVGASQKEQELDLSDVSVVSLKDLGEELRSLRRVISEDFLRGISELSQKSESHRCLASAVSEELNSPKKHQGQGQQHQHQEPQEHGQRQRQQRQQRQHLQEQHQQQPHASVWSMRSCCIAERLEPEQSAAIIPGLKGQRLE